MARLPRTTNRPTRSALARLVADAILYGRVSSDDQAEAGTIDAQKTFLRDYAALDKLNVVGEYWDDGVSGTIPLPERPAGARLLEMAASHPGAIVVVYRLDRLGRKLRVVLDAHEALEEMGVSVRSGTEPFDSSTPFGTFMLQFTASMAELDRSTTLEKLARGRDRVAQTGKWTGGPIPFGYDLDPDGCLVPSLRPVGDRTEADIAREVIEAGLASGDTERIAAARREQRGVIEDLVAGIVVRTELQNGRKRAVAEITYVFGDPNVVDASRAVPSAPSGASARGGPARRASGRPARAGGPP